MMIVCSVVTMLAACGGGGSGSDGGLNASGDARELNASGDARELEAEQFVDGFIDEVSAGKVLSTDEDLSGVWLSVSGGHETIDSNCENDSEFTLSQSRYIAVLHVADQGDVLKVQHCSTDYYSWNMYVDADGRVVSEKENNEDEEFEGVLSNNNSIDFGSRHYSYDKSEICSGHYEGRITQKMIKLSDDVSARVGVLTSSGIGDVDISCFFADLDTKEGEGDNLIGRSIVIYSDEDTGEEGSYLLYLTENEHLFSVGEVTVSGKTITISPVGEESAQFVFD